MQQCLGNINASSRCRLYQNLKEDFELAPYLRKNKNKDLRQCLTKIRLSSHKFFIERDRWLKPKVEYCDRLCTRCERRDIEDELGGEKFQGGEIFGRGSDFSVEVRFFWELGFGNFSVGRVEIFLGRVTTFREGLRFVREGLRFFREGMINFRGGS